MSNPDSLTSLDSISPRQAHRHSRTSSEISNSARQEAPPIPNYIPNPQLVAHLDRKKPTGFQDPNNTMEGRRIGRSSRNELRGFGEDSVLPPAYGDEKPQPELNHYRAFELDPKRFINTFAESLNRPCGGVFDVQPSRKFTSIVYHQLESDRRKWLHNTQVVIAFGGLYRAMEQTKVGHDRKVAVQRVVAEDMFPEYQDQKTTMVSRDQRYVAVHNGATIEHKLGDSLHCLSKALWTFKEAVKDVELAQNTALATLPTQKLRTASIFTVQKLEFLQGSHKSVLSGVFSLPVSTTQWEHFRIAPGGEGFQIIFAGACDAAEVGLYLPPVQHLYKPVKQNWVARPSLEANA